MGSLAARTLQQKGAAPKIGEKKAKKTKANKSARGREYWIQFYEKHFLDLITAPEYIRNHLQPLIEIYCNEVVPQDTSVGIEGDSVAVGDPDLANIKSHSYESSPQVLRFWYWVLLHLEECKHTFARFSQPAEIESLFQVYDPRAEYWFRTNEVEEQAGPTKEVAAIRRLARYFSARSMAMELEIWGEAAENDTKSVRDFVRARICRKSEGQQESDEYKQRVADAVLAVRNGTRGRTLERVTKKAAMSLFVGFAGWKFELSEKEIEESGAVLANEKFSRILRVAEELKESHAVTQEKVNKCLSNQDGPSGNLLDDYNFGSGQDWNIWPESSAAELLPIGVCDR